MSRPDGRPALFNDGGLDLAPRLELPDPPSGLAVFPDTGYAVVRRGRFWLAFDCGPPGPLVPACTRTRRRALVPALVRRSARSSSTRAPRPTSRARSATGFARPRAHSTVAIDGGSQFVPWAAFRAGSFPDVCLDEAGEEALAGRVVWRNGVTHIRRVTWEDGAVVVRDRIEGAGRHRMTSRLVLAPGPGATPVAALDSAPVTTEPGYVSERFGQREQADVLVLAREGVLPLELGWRISCA